MSGQETGRFFIDLLKKNERGLSEKKKQWFAKREAR